MRLIFPYKGTPFYLEGKGDLTFVNETILKYAINSIDIIYDQRVVFYINNIVVTELEYLNWEKEQQFNDDMKKLLS